jgi:hypothetical protein
LTNARFARTVTFARTQHFNWFQPRKPTWFTRFTQHNTHSGQRYMKSQEWKTYRTRFLVKSKQLTSNLTFVDHLGRQHSGRKGDYLVESSDGVLSIAPRRIFEDIYVPMSQVDEPESSVKKAPLSAPAPDHRRVEALTIQEVKLPERKLPSSPVPSRTDTARANVAGTNTARIVARDDSGRGSRKLPQPCRLDPSGPRLGLM